jgi:hypothetical protein
VKPWSLADKREFRVVLGKVTSSVNPNMQKKLLFVFVWIGTFDDWITQLDGFV